MKKQLRKIEEIQKEYHKACAELGQATHNYKIEMVAQIEKAKRDAESTIISLEKTITKLKKEANDVTTYNNFKQNKEEAQPNA